MMITIENNSKHNLDFNFEDLIKTVVSTATDFVNCPYEAEVFVELTDNGQIQDINKRFRNMDKPTDVLSFPLIEYKTPGVFDDFDEDESLFNPDSGELMLGDIILSVEKAEEQAAEFNHGIVREVAFLVAHSMLHLFGYDHIESDDVENMEVMQEEILNRLGIKR